MRWQWGGAEEVVLCRSARWPEYAHCFSNQVTRPWVSGLARRPLRWAAHQLIRNETPGRTQKTVWPTTRHACAAHRADTPVGQLQSLSGYVTQQMAVLTNSKS
jgi:hypothetical protein